MANLLKNRPAQKEEGKSRERGEETAFTEQDLCNLRSAVCVAEEVGAGLGIGEILQRSVPEIGWKFAWIKGPLNYFSSCVTIPWRKFLLETNRRKSTTRVWASRLDKIVTQI